MIKTSIEPSQGSQTWCWEFTGIDQGNQVDIWYIYDSARDKRLLHRLLILFDDMIRKTNCLSLAICLVLHSTEIPVLVFVQLPSLEELDDNEEFSDSNDADFEIKDDSAHKWFDQHELIKFGTIKKGFRTPSINTKWEKLAWKRSKVIIAFCIVITYRAYRRN